MQTTIERLRFREIAARLMDRQEAAGADMTGMTTMLIRMADEDVAEMEGVSGRLGPAQELMGVERRRADIKVTGAIQTIPVIIIVS